MPTVRALAAELDLAVNTVAKAYRALEADHVIETRGRAGSFVSATGDPTTREAQLAAIAYADRVHHLGIDARPRSPSWSRRSTPSGDRATTER